MGNEQNNKKGVLITIVAGVVVLSSLVWWVRQTPPSQRSQAVPTSTLDAEATEINAEVETINVGNLNTELELIDEDIQGL